MAKFKKRSAADALPEGGVLQLRCGRDFFGRAFGSDVDAMRAAWQDDQIREQVWAAHRSRHGDEGRPWACFAFGDDGTGGMVQTAADIREAQSLYWEGTHAEQAREATQWAFNTGRIDAAEYAEHMARLGQL